MCYSLHKCISRKINVKISIRFYDFQPAEVENGKGPHADDSPTVKRPSPYAIGIIERFLREKRRRLIDLFSATDKDKSWTLTRAEFKAAVQQVSIITVLNTVS